MSDRKDHMCIPTNLTVPDVEAQNTLVPLELVAQLLRMELPEQRIDVAAFFQQAIDILDAREAAARNPDAVR